MRNWEKLNEGVSFTASDPEKLKWKNAYYGSFIGLDPNPVNFGLFLKRVATVLTGETVVAHVHKAAQPGPILAVQATAGGSTGIKSIGIVGAASAGEVVIETDDDGFDTLTFATTDAVTVCAYRQLVMPAEMMAKLLSDTDPA